MSETREQREQLGPARPVPGEIARRLRQHLKQRRREHQRHDAAGQEQRPPAVSRQDFRTKDAGERAAQRNADDGQGDGKRTMAARDVFGRERRGIRHRATKSQSGKEAQHAEHRDAVGERHQDREQAERDHAAEQRNPAADPVADHAAGGAAQHHAEHAGGEDRCERRPGQSPLAHERGNGRREQLVVETVENDRQCGPGDQELLISAPVRLVEQRADISGLHHESPLPAVPFLRAMSWQSPRRSAGATSRR